MSVFRLRNKKFLKFSRLLWIVLASVILFAASIFQFGVRGQEVASGLDNAMIEELDGLSSVNYGGLVWALESVRVSPPDKNDVITIIVDVKIQNRVPLINLRMPKHVVSLVNNEGQSLKLDRFANNESTNYVYVKSGEIKEISLPFKLVNRKVSFENWSLKVQENSRKTPALLPLVGEPPVAAIALEVNEPLIVESKDTKISLGRVVSQLNHGANRASNGSKFLFVHVSLDGDLEITGAADKQAWSLNDKTALEVNVSKITELNSELTVVFSYPEDVDSLEMQSEFLNGFESQFKIEPEPVG